MICGTYLLNGVKADVLPGSTFIELDEVHVPVDHLIGEENKGFPLIMSSEYHLPLLLCFSVNALNSRLQSRTSYSGLRISPTVSCMRRGCIQLCRPT